MSDGWGRPAADGAPAELRDAVVVDVPLTGDDDATRPRGDDEPPTTHWRRLVGVALAAGVALGVVVASVRLATGDGGDDADSTPTGEQGVVAITTPPTLRPLETLPPPASIAADGEAANGPFTRPASPEPVVVPTYPPASDAALSENVEYDIGAAIARNDDDVARRSDTHVELGYGGYVLDVTIERDPEHDRYRVVFESSDSSEEVIVDVATDTTYINPGTENEVTIPNDDILAPGDTDIRDYFDGLLRGPLRAETFDAAATRGRGIVTIDGVGDAREFVSYVDGDLVPEWQIYSFGPVGEFRPSDRPALLEYAVYVDEAGRIVQVDGVAMLDNVPQLVQHRMTVLDDPVAINLPGELPGERLVEPPSTPSP